jgi:hypothetical protein
MSDEKLREEDLRTYNKVIEGIFGTCTCSCGIECNGECIMKCFCDCLCPTITKCYGKDECYYTETRGDKEICICKKVCPNRCIVCILKKKLSYGGALITAIKQNRPDVFQKLCVELPDEFFFTINWNYIGIRAREQKNQDIIECSMNAIGRESRIIEQFLKKSDGDEEDYGGERWYGDYEGEGEED